MHIAVELIMKRMESNPNEFVKGHRRHPKWERIIEKYMEFLNSEDKKLLKEKYSLLQLDQMHKEVMAELLYGDEREEGAFVYEDPRQMELMLEFEKFKYQQLTEQGLFKNESTT